MQILAITSQKGGVGKTTLAMNLAVAAAATGRPTIIFDLDPQGSAAAYHDSRMANGGNAQPKVSCIQPVRLPHELKAAMSDGYALAIIDTPPNVSGDAVHISQAGDLILIPVKPSAIDLNAIRSTIGIAKQTGRPSAVVLNLCRHNGSLPYEARDLIENDFEFPVASQTVGDRVAFVHAATTGLSVLESEPESKAANEIRGLWKWIEALLAETGEVHIKPKRGATNG